MEKIASLVKKLHFSIRFNLICELIYLFIILYFYFLNNISISRKDWVFHQSRIAQTSRWQHLKSGALERISLLYVSTFELDPIYKSRDKKKANRPFAVLPPNPIEVSLAYMCCSPWPCHLYTLGSS